MRDKVALLVVTIPVLLEVNKALEALALIPIYNEGIQVAAAGGDITPYIVAMIGVLVTVALPVGLLQAVADV